MNIIGIYLSVVEWYSICEIMRQLEEPYSSIAAHILDEIGRISGIAPEFFEPQHGTCKDCIYLDICKPVCGLPCCKDFEKKD